MIEQVSFFRLEEGPAVVRMPAKVAAPAPVRPAATKPPAHAAAAADHDKSAPAKPAAKRGGIVGRMQAGLATALKQDADWEEF